MIVGSVSGDVASVDWIADADDDVDPHVDAALVAEVENRFRNVRGWFGM